MTILQRVIFGILYTFGFLVIVFLSIGAGEGTYIFVPALITWPLIIICLALLSWPGRTSIRVLFVLLMLLHYAVSIALAFYVEIAWDDLFSTKSYINYYPFAFAIYILWYGLGQVVIWTAFVRRSTGSQLR